MNEQIKLFTNAKDKLTYIPGCRIQKTKHYNKQ
jgi:hypothetical protein